MVLGLDDITSASIKIPETELVEKTAGPLINIIEAILSTGGEYVSKGILAICNVFTLKCSPCLHLLIFRMLKRIVMQDTILSSQHLIKLLLEYKAIQNIMYLLSNTHCLDLKAMCIKFLNILVANANNVKNIFLVFLMVNLA